MTKPRDKKRELEIERTEQMLKAANRLIRHFTERYERQMAYKRSMNMTLTAHDKETLDMIEKYSILKSSLRKVEVEELTGATNDLMIYDDPHAVPPEPYDVGDKYPKLEEWEENRNDKWG